MAENKCLREEYLKEYWKLVSERQGVCKTSRESVKESIISFDVKKSNRVQTYQGDAWERMCRYKLARYGDEMFAISKDTFDCDVAYLTVLQYAIAFPDLEGWVIQDQSGSEISEDGRHEFVNSEMTFKYRGDTMNSYATTVHQFLKLSKEIDGQISERKILRALLDNRLNSETVPRIFIRLNHTIGNFTPVPFERDGKEFNSPRGLGEIKDYWDLTLAAIYKWYKQGKNCDELLKNMLMKNEENISLCTQWLGRFGSWEAFVKRNYMQDFVEGPESGPFGRPKELWKDHFINYFMCGNAKPIRQEQCKEFFDNASMWILARGKRIAEVIMQELEKVDGCHPWKK